MVRYKIGVTAPTSVIDGTQVYNGALTGYGHTGLSPGTSYSYSVWSVSEGGALTQYSDTYISGTAMTSSTSVYLAQFKYYIPITITSQCSTEQELRVPFIINSDGLFDAGYVQPDFDDVVLARVDTLMPLTVTDISATTLHQDGEATSTAADNKTIVDTTLTQANDYWNNCIAEITETTDGLVPEGETKTVGDFVQATHWAIMTDNFTAVVHDGDLYTLDNFRSKYFTNVTLAPYQSVELDLYLGNASENAADRWLCTDYSDSIYVAHNADYNITDNLTLNTTVKIFDLPSVERHFLSKNGAYEIGLDTLNRPYIKLWHAAGTDNATGSALSEDTEYVLTGTYNDASDNITLYVDGAVVGSTADANGAISTSGTNIILANLDNVEVDDIKIGKTSLLSPTYVLNLQMEATHIGESSILDQSTATHNASVTWDITMPDCVTVEVGAVVEVATWESPGSTEQEDLAVFDLPTTPTSTPPGEATSSNWALLGNRGTWNNLPAYSLMTAAASQLGWSDATMYRIMVVFTAIGFAVAIGIATASALLTAIACGAILAMGAGAGIIGWSLLVLYGLFAGGYIVASRSM